MPALTYDKNGNILGGPPPDSSQPTQSPFNPDIIQAKIKNSAQHYGVDPNLALAVAKQESSFNPNATSPAGAVGVMQLMPETAKSYGVDPNERNNPDKNIDAGVHYLSDLQKKHGGDKAKMLIEYNSGPKNTEKNFEDLPEETQGYLTNILGPNARSQSGPTIYDKNGNVVGGDISKSPFAQTSQHFTPAQLQAKQNLNQTLSTPEQKFRNAAVYAPEVLGAIGGLFGNVGSATGAGLGEIVAGSAEHGVPNEEDLKRAVEAGVSGYALGKLFALPNALRSQVLKSLESKAGKSADILEGARQDITGGIPSGETKGAQNVLGAKLAPVKSAEDVKWEKVNARMDKASHVFDAVSVDPSTGQQTVTPTPIRGPIKLSKETLDYINSTKQQLADIVNKFPSPKLLNAYNSLNRVGQGAVTDKNGDTYLPFDAIKQLRTDIGAATSTESKINLQAPNKSIGLQRGGGVLTGLRDKLGSDIESTLTDMGPDALKEYGDAVGMTKTRVKASLFDKVISRNTNEGTGMLNVDKAINDFKNPTSIYSKEFSSEERNSIVNALNAVRSTSPQYDGAMKYGAQGPGKFIFYSAYAAAHPLKFAVAVTSKDLFEKVLSQPKYARILSQLPSAPSKSSQANMMTKSLFKGALQSVPAEMIAPSGFRVKGHIDENGEPKPDFQMGTAQ